jgi:dihydrofolate reductase
MRELILRMFMSLDGFVGTTDGNPAWWSPDPMAKEWGLERAWNSGLHVMGSRTFRDMAGYWPISTDAFAPAMNQIPKAVFSKQGPAILDAVRTEQAKAEGLQPNAQTWAEAYVASGDLVQEVNRLKAEDGKPIYVYGGASFARSLITNGLVDQFDLMVHPVLLGRGLPIFTDLPGRQQLTLVSSTAFPKGAVAQVYRPA